MRHKLIPWPHEYGKRKWQERFRQQFWQSIQQKRDFLLVACPAAGKTDATMTILVGLLGSGKADRAVIVCPTDEVCTQWIRKAKKFGIELTRAGAESKEFHGVVVTYAQVVSGWFKHRELCALKTAVIFDEVHHCADGMQWGDTIRQAFETAEYRIALSGTPFRQDNRPIPFITYEGGSCVPDFTYGLQRAMDDQVCRMAFFPTVDGSAQWLVNGITEKRVRISHALSEADRAGLFKTVLDPSGEWVATTIRAAAEKTEQCRRLGHRDAGELWLCVDQAHAKAIATVIAEVTGEAPVLVISEDPKAADKIQAFRNGKQKRLVSVRQVSEGVDIPRLRVLVYATNVLSELFFRQALGRISRWEEGLDEQSSYFYIPRIPELVDCAMEVINERNHMLQEEVSPQGGRRGGGGGGDMWPLRNVIEPIASEGVMSHVIGGGQEYSQTALEQARTLIQFMQSPAVQEEDLAVALVRAGMIPADGFTPPSAPVKGIEEKPLEFRKKEVRSRIARVVNQWAYMDGVEPATLHGQWKQQTGIATAQATMPHLEAKLAWAQEGLSKMQRKRDAA